MKSIEKRISVIEKMLTQKKAEGAWLAFIEEDGTVHLSLIKHDDIFLNSREQLNEFIKLHDLGRFDLIIVDHVDMQGEPLKSYKTALVYHSGYIQEPHRRNLRAVLFN